jgi:hypothetical protein
MSDGIAGNEFVGIDLHLHLHRSVIGRMSADGEELGWVRIDNDPKALVRAEWLRAPRRRRGFGGPVLIALGCIVVLAVVITLRAVLQV